MTRNKGSGFPILGHRIYNVSLKLMKSGRSNLTRLQQCRIKLLGALCQTQMGAPCPLSLPSPYPCRTPSLPFKVGFGTYRHNDEKCTATVHSYWLYNTIIPVYHKPTITVSLLWRRIVIYSITHGPRDEGRVFRVGGGYWKGHTVWASPLPTS